MDVRKLAVKDQTIALDWDAPDTVVDGERHFVVRCCRVPFEWDCSTSKLLTASTDPGEPGEPVDGQDWASLPAALADQRSREARREAGDDDADDGAEGDDGAGLDKGPIVEGVASSTSVDWYHTEMSLAALASMADQMRAGTVPYVPTHWECEWHDVMGRVFDARVERAAVRNPHPDDADGGAVLRMAARLDVKQQRSEQLAQRLADGHRIGQSVGGWFTELRFIYDDDGDLSRIIIEDIELDHLAVTRSPANPDSWITNLRSLPGLLSTALDADDATASDQHYTVRFSRTRTADPGTPRDAGESATRATFPAVDVVPSDGTPDPAGVDTRGVAGDDEGERDNGDARRGAPGEDDDAERSADLTPDTEGNMDPKELRALIAEAVIEAVAPVTVRLSALEASARSAAPAAEPPPAVDPAVAELRATVDRLTAESAAREETIRTLVNEPLRRGISREMPAAERSPTFHGEMATQLRERGCHAMASIVTDERRMKLLTCDADEHLPERRKDAQANLRAVLRAAEADGLLLPPELRTTVGWA